MRFELRHAGIVTSIASAGSISAAAAELSIPQPSLTVQLRRIERALGGQLFVRSRTGVRPTPLGERLIPMLADLVLRSEAVLLESRAGTSVLRLGVWECTSVGLRRAVDAALPDVEVQTTTVSTGHAVAGVQDGALTAALLPRTDPDGGPRPTAPGTGTRAGTLATVLSAEPVWLAVPEAHPWAAQPEVIAEQLGALRWVRRTSGHWFSPVESWVLRRLGAAGAPVVHRAAGQGEALEWVAEASVVALVGGAASAPGVVVLPLEAPAVLEVVLLHRESGLAGPLLDQLVGGLRGHFSQRARTQPRYGQWLRHHLHEHPELAGHLGPR